MNNEQRFDLDRFETEFEPGDGLIAFFEAERSELIAECGEILAKCAAAGNEIQGATEDLMEVGSALLSLGSDLVHLISAIYEHTQPDLEGCAGCLEDLTSQSTEAVRNLISVARQLLEQRT